jgi:hypothetical protein
MSDHDHRPRLADALLTRRALLNRTGMGFGGLALGSLLAETMGPSAARADGDTGTVVNPLAPKRPPFPAKARHVIHIFANGGPSQVDTFDPKPELSRLSGKALPAGNLPTERKTGAALGSPFSFKKYGQSGLEISEIFDTLGQWCADDLCVIRSMHADVPNHEPSLMLMNCGNPTQARPSMGSWALYGLGTENQNLPGFIVMCPGGYPISETQNWQTAFLPGVFQGTYIDSQHTDIEKLVADIRNRTMGTPEQRSQLDLLMEMNRHHAEERRREADLEARIQSFELAYRMQTEASDAFDIEREPAHVRAMYGEGTHARMMLVARRLVERGVRYVQLWQGAGQPWDNHDDLEAGHRNLAKQTDRPIAALVRDLKQRGMLDDTLVLWGGEFGRTPVVEMPTPGSNAGKMNGRDHNHYGFTMWMAGGGVKGGHVHGSTDEFGYKAVADPVHVHDLHATILHLLGFDHEKFTFRYAGRDFRLTDVEGNVVRSILA